MMMVRIVGHCVVLNGIMILFLGSAGMVDLILALLLEIHNLVVSQHG